MEEIKYFGKSPREIAEQYFNKSYLINEGRTEQEIEALYEGFVEGLEYLYPTYHDMEWLVNLLKKHYEQSKSKD